MNETLARIDDLDELIADKAIGHRADALRRITDLFVSTSGQISDDQVALFDDVMGKLVREIDASARAAYSARMASLPDTPPQVVRTLALDDNIEVAEPILANSERLDEATLVEGAKTKSQGHLLAISRRSSLSEAVTDVLVDRGNREVALSTAGNHGARFSEQGYSTLVQRAEADGDLAAQVWAMPAIPRQHLLKLFSDASAAVQSRLCDVDSNKAALIRTMVSKASEQIQAKSREDSPVYAAAEASVRALHASGQLSEARLADFANAGKFEEAAIALSILCGLPIGSVERVFLLGEWGHILVLAKAIGASWDTVRALLKLKLNPAKDSGAELESLYRKFTSLTPGTAARIMQFYELRARAAVAKAKR